MWGNKASTSQGLLGSGVFRDAIGPLLLMVSTNIFLGVILASMGQADWSLEALSKGLLGDPVGYLSTAFQWPSTKAIQILLTFAGFELALIKLVPGNKFEGPVTPAGNVPKYTANGFQCFVITLVAYLLGAYWFRVFDPSDVYDHYPQMLTAMTMFSLALCVLLYFKGLYAPSSTDCGSNGNFLMDIYWGTELYPRVLGWDVKLFTNCRFGMMAWVLVPLVCAHKNMALNGGALSPAMACNAALQLIYCAKFFLWETGYLASMDIMHDRAGYYLCWGCCVWVPSVYMIHSLFLVNHSNDLPALHAAVIFAVGFAAIFINYDADRQRAVARATKGNTIIWGKKPVMIEASYKTEKGETKSSLLLVSGWWGVARHFHYLPEITAAFCWSAPAGLTHFLPYFYVTFLTILLLDRAYRDDQRCRAKYGKFWDAYCKQVPYKIIPGLI